MSQIVIIDLFLVNKWFVESMMNCFIGSSEVMICWIKLNWTFILNTCIPGTGNKNHELWSKFCLLCTVYYLCHTTSVRRRALFSRKPWAAPLSRTWWVIMVQRTTSLRKSTRWNELWWKYSKARYDTVWLGAWWGTWEQWARRPPAVDSGGDWTKPGRWREGVPHTSV